MSIVKLSDINELISQMNLAENNWGIITSQINDLKITPGPSNICDSWDRSIIYDRFFNYEYPSDREINDEDLIDKMCNFILGDNIPNGQDNTERYKDYLSKYFSESMKEKLLEKYLNSVLINSKCCYIEPDDFSKELYYNPRINNIPLKYNNGVKIEMKFNDIKDILLGKAEIQDVNQKAIIMSLLKNEEFFQGPWLTDYIIELKNKLINEKIDLMLANHIIEYDKNLVNVVKNGSKNFTFNVDDSFLDEIISSIPSELSHLEQSIYLYSKLCRIFTYDSVFFLDKHASDVLDVDNMDKYNRDNNSIVCHNFAYILSVALKKIGINDVKEKMTVLYEKEFNGHSNISYLVDDMVIFADSTKEVIGGDLEVHKFSNELNGIRCEMYSAEKQQEFMKSKEKVLSIIKYEDLMIESLLPNKESVEHMDIKDKYYLFNNYLENIDFTNVDFISYAKKLIDILGLNIDTRIMYKKDDLSNILLKVSLKGYAFDGSKESLEYIIDSNTKQVIIGDELDITEKEILTTRKGK